MIPLSLAHLTALDVEPEPLAALAASAGYQSIGLRVLPAAPGGIAYPLTPASVRRWRAACARSGVGVHDIEFVALTPEVDVRALAPVLALGAELGARRLNVSGDDPDLSRLVDHFGALCDLALDHGLGVDLELMRFRLVGSLPHALAVVTGAGRRNGRLLVDTLHFHRAGVTPEALAAVPPQWIGSVQLCDAPHASPAPDRLAFEAREARLFPGEGALPLEAYLAALPADAPLGVEVPTASTWPQLGALERAARGARGAREVLSRVPGRG